LEFSGNVAHGCNMGIDVHDGLQLKAGELLGAENGTENLFTQNFVSRKNLAWTPRIEVGEELIDVPGYLDDMTIYGCKTGVYTGIAPGSVTFRWMRAADNEKSLFLASYDTVHTSWFLADSGLGIRARTAPGALPTPEDLTVEAFRMYDGAGTAIDTRFEGFGTPRERLIGTNAAANRFLNHRFVRCEHYSGAGASRTLPRVEWADFQCFIDGGDGMSCDWDGFATDGCTITGDQLLPMKKTRTWGLVIQDTTGTLFDGAGNAKTLVANPTILLENDGTDVLYGDALHVFESPREFGLIKLRAPSTQVFYNDDGCPQAPSEVTCPLWVASGGLLERQHGPASVVMGSVDILNFAVTPTPGDATQVQVPIQTFPFVQFPVTASFDVRNVMDLKVPPHQTHLYTDGCNPETDSGTCYDEIHFWLSDLNAGTRTVFGLENWEVISDQLAAANPDVDVRFEGASVPITTPPAGTAVMEVELAVDDAAIYDSVTDTLYLVVLKDKDVFTSQETVVLDKSDTVTINW
ncbi:MAG: hypothetical protein AAFP86_03440, partial [Planctomycetota bacterium]